MRFSDQNEIENRFKRRAKQRRRDITWNLLTAVILMLTIFLVGFYLVLFSNPYVAFNPFPPPTMPVLATALPGTATPLRLPPTWTPTLPPTEAPPLPNTPISATTPAESTSTASPLPLFTDEPVNQNLPYAIEGEPAAMANTVFHPGEGCDWQGVAGRVVDLQGRPMVGVVVKLTGLYGGRTIDMTTLSGGAAAWYGASGYEFILGDKPVSSNAMLAVQLVDQALMPLSNRVIFHTYETCDKNLILINFKQVR
jgi:hypothetical protein